MCMTTTTGNSDGLGVFSCCCGLVVLLDLREPPEDPRATRGGDKFSVAERAAETDGSRCREVQRELRGSKPKSRGTEIEKFTTWGVAPRTTDGEYWKFFVAS
jgi:hypothetical protein